MTMKKTITGFAVLIGLASAASSAQAQARFATSSTDVVKAEKLEAQAKALYESPKEYRKAARLHVQAAELRPAGDIERVNDLRQAARLFYYSGAETTARETMVQAGDAAMADGDVVNAAGTFLDAAFLYRDAGMQATANELIRKAHLLSNSPLLSASDREAILSRIQATA